MSREGERNKALTWLVSGAIKAHCTQQNCVPLSPCPNFPGFLRIPQDSREEIGEGGQQGICQGQFCPGGWMGQGEWGNVSIRTGHLHFLASTAFSGSKLTDPVWAVKSRLGCTRNLFDSLNSLLAQELEIPRIFFVVYLLTTYIWSCLSMQTFNPKMWELWPTPRVGPIILMWTHLYLILAIDFMSSRPCLWKATFSFSFLYLLEILNSIS